MSLLQNPHHVKIKTSLDRICDLSKEEQKKYDKEDNYRLRIEVHADKDSYVIDEGCSTFDVAVYSLAQYMRELNSVEIGQ